MPYHQPVSNASVVPQSTTFSGPSSIEPAQGQQQTQPGLQRSLGSAGSFTGPSSVPEAFGSTAGVVSSSPYQASPMAYSNSSAAQIQQQQGPLSVESQMQRPPHLQQQQQQPTSQQYFSPMTNTSFEVS